MLVLIPKLQPKMCILNQFKRIINFTSIRHIPRLLTDCSFQLRFGLPCPGIHDDGRHPGDHLNGQCDGGEIREEEVLCLKSQEADGTL